MDNNPMISGKSIEDLEGDYWGNPPSDATRLVKTCYTLRKKLIECLDIEEMRLLISQGIGNKYILPLAISALETNILAEGDFYPGDLLISVLNVEDSVWNTLPTLKEKLKKLLEQKAEEIESAKISQEIKQDLTTAKQRFWVS